MKKTITTALAASLVTTGAFAFTQSDVPTGAADVIEISTDITSDVTLRAQDEYVLTDHIFVKDGAVLTIPGGTVLRGEPKSTGNYDAGTLIITRSGQIDANGSPDFPIIFTTAAIEDGTTGELDNTVEYDDGDGVYDYTTSSNFLDAAPKTAPLLPGKNFSTTAGNTAHLNTQEYRGLWGGVIILGSAPTSIGSIAADISSDGSTLINKKIVATVKNARSDLDDAYEGFVEGLDPNVTGNNDGVYGGTNPNDSSGTFRYVSIRHGGNLLAEANEINGLTMGGVGYGTLLEFVEVYCNLDDGYEWFGGTVNSRYLVSLFNNDDSFDIDEGFTGLGQFWFSLGLDDGANGERAGEHDGTDANFTSVNVDSINGVTQGSGDAGAGLAQTYVTVYNATYIGGGAGLTDGTATDDGGGAKENEVFRLRDSWGGAYFNSIFADFEGEFISTESDQDTRIAAGDVIFRSNYIYNMHNGDTTPTNGTFTMVGNNTFPTATAPDTAANNNVFGTSNPFQMATIVRRAGVDPRVNATVDASVTREDTTATFFINAPYIGAFDPNISAKWTDDWTVFDLRFD